MIDLSVGKKKCSKCKIVKELYRFYPDKNNSTGFHSHCICCKNKKHDPIVQASKENLEKEFSMQEKFLLKNKPKKYTQTL